MRRSGLALFLPIFALILASCVRDEDFLAVQHDLTQVDRRLVKVESGTQTQLSTLEQSQRTHTGTLEETLTRLSNIERSLDSLEREQKNLVSRLDRLEKNQLKDKQEISSSMDSLRKDTATSTTAAIDKIRGEFNAAQKELSKGVDQTMSSFSKSMEGKIQKLDNEISGFYREMEKTIQGYSSDTYVVKPGETLSKIAQQLGVSVEALSKANNIQDPSKIHAGQELVVPH